MIKSHIAWGVEPPVGAFIQYDRRVKIYTYNEICTAHDKCELVMADYSTIDIGDVKPRWAKSDDVDKHNLKKWSK